MKTIPVAVISDTVCPWCFVGKKRLEIAMSEFKKKNDVHFDVRWLPYQLNPSAPTEGEDKLTMYKAKFGEARVAQMLPMMTKTFSDLGVSYSIGGLTGSTLDSHRLIHWAGEVGGAAAQDAVVSELFANYFSEVEGRPAMYRSMQEKFINDRAVLIAAAEKAGLKGAAEYLADPESGLAAVKASIASKARGVSGVPHFTIGNMIQLSGAQEPATFIQAFEKALQE